MDATDKLEIVWLELNNKIEYQNKQLCVELSELRSRVKDLESVHLKPTLREFLLQDTPTFIPRGANFLESIPEFKQSIQVHLTGTENSSELDRKIWESLIGRTPDNKLRDLVDLVWSRDAYSDYLNTSYFFMLFGYRRE